MYKTLNNKAEVLGSFNSFQMYSYFRPTRIDLNVNKNVGLSNIHIHITRLI